ncbi:glycosyltransferase [Fictibacillus aquaticus]|uniref:Glycosyl transferase n=1 Tax=Fictibacillus aquaticus TaxID=2021314 RepID=A0A235FBP9_9BACL|nr:glycosyltransferase [Fictibacillus aquaticus]OYD58619.1 glycosyl transferase [Fictibacillus aquaticus]
MTLHLSEVWLSIVYGFGLFILIYMTFVVLFYGLLFFLSAFQLKREEKVDDLEKYEDYMDSSYTKPVSIIVPAFNEELGIKGSIRSLLSINYPEYEIIVVNDGSNDRTAESVIEYFHMTPVKKALQTKLATERVKGIYQSSTSPNLWLVDKFNGGKADALNAGLNVSTYPYFCSLDGDSVLERDAFLKVMKPIIDSDESIIASGGSIRVANGCSIHEGQIEKIGLSKNPIVIMQVIEYLRAFLMGRIGLSRYNWLLIISGAFGVFSKKWVIDAGGYKRDTVGEDMELVVRLQRLIKDRKTDKKIVYVPDPVCWTEAPESATYLRRQRSRWHRGLFESLWIHKKMLLNPKYGSIGMISLPYFWLIELAGPVVELCGYLFVLLSFFLGGIYTEMAILFFLLSILYSAISSMGAVILEEWSLRKYPAVKDIVTLFIYSLTETIWYRPLTVLWRCEGLIHAVTGRKGWGEMKRKGISGGLEQ